MGQYRKRPVTIDAVQFDGQSEYPAWLVDAFAKGDVWYQGGNAPYLTIRTLEGEMRANVGDWVIRGVAGEIYPCKPGIFAATYEPA